MRYRSVLGVRWMYVLQYQRRLHVVLQNGEAVYVSVGRPERSDLSAGASEHLKLRR